MKNREFAWITYAFVAIFLFLMIHIVYFMFHDSEEFISSPYNTRQDVYAATVVRGSILDANREILAKTDVNEDGEETRVYPYGSLFSHLVGFSDNGKSGVESIANFRLLRSHAFFLEKTVNDIREKKNMGDNVVLTLDTRLQRAASEALGGYYGAIVVMEVKTGKILAMVSKPDFDPNTIKAEWDQITQSGSSVLVNRATQGLYPPGSVFKILTSLEYMKENRNYESFTYDCTGSITVGGNTINCYHNNVHGTEDLKLAFAKSCNSAYSEIGLKLKTSSFQNLCNSMLFNTPLPIALESNQSKFSLKKSADQGEIMQKAIGQGDTQVTPLHMCLLASAIANDGVLMKPYFIDRIENYNQAVVKQYRSSVYGELLSEEQASVMQEFMRYVVTDGTGSVLNDASYTSAGKTGSAEYSNTKGESHAWFVGYMPAEEPEIAISIIAEGGGAGSSVAVPMAKQVFDVYHSLPKETP